MKWSDDTPRPGAPACVALVLLALLIALALLAVTAVVAAPQFRATQTGVDTVQFCAAQPGNLFALQGDGRGWWYEYEPNGGPLPAGCTTIRLEDNRWRPYLGRRYALEIGGVWHMAAPLDGLWRRLYLPVVAR